jgi:nucleotide-binding universal stress UspA family protein
VFKAVGVEELIVLETPMATSPLASIYPASLLEKLLADAHARPVNAVEGARKILETARLKVLDQEPIPVGDPRTTILDVAQARPADLVVLSSHGRRGWDRFLMDSVAESVAVHAHCSAEVI